MRVLALMIVFVGWCTAANAQAVSQGEVENFETLVKNLERPDRASWQKPEEVIGRLGMVKNKKVLDLGCGTGYFSFRLVDSGATVIAADIDERFVAYVDSVKKARKISDKNLQPRLVAPDDPKLAKREADIVLLVNTYHHIVNRVEYFKKVRAGMKTNSYIVIIDYFKKDLPMGPPKEKKVSPDDIVRELKMAGFKNFKVEETVLPFQYIVYGM